MPESARSIPATEYEDAVKRVRDIVAVRVVQDSSGEIVEIHALAGPARASKHIARDIESSLMAAFGVTVDRRTISVAQLGPGNGTKRGGRPLLERIEIISEADFAQVNVGLGLGENRVVGVCRRTPTVRGWLAAAAGAAVDALMQLTPPGFTFYVEDVGITQSRPNKVAWVSVILTTAGRQEVLTGSCPVGYDEREAVVKAVLDALNRRIAHVLQG